MLLTNYQLRETKEHHLVALSFKAEEMVVEMIMHEANRDLIKNGGQASVVTGVARTDIQLGPKFAKKRTSRNTRRPRPKTRPTIMMKTAYQG